MLEPSAFCLNERLAADSLFVGVFELCQVRLMNNRLWPWLILVPQIEGVREIHQLPAAARAQLMEESAASSEALTLLFPIDKVNVGALGNIVSQLHVHVVGRTCGDAAWPGPVWGSGFAEPYDDEEAGTIVRRLHDHFGMADTGAGNAQEKPRRADAG